jgi:hypothetical protein
MNNKIGQAILALGIGLIFFGINESLYVATDFSRFLTGNPADRALWMICAGIVAVVAGSVMAIRCPRN